MKYFLIAMIVVLLVYGCATVTEQPSLESPDVVEIEEAKILDAYPDGLDEALAELDLIG